MSILTEKIGSVFYIKFNNVKRKNAINETMYDEIIAALEEANRDEDTFLTVFTGVGDEFYSSGNDFGPNNLSSLASGADKEVGFKKWVDRLIGHRKALIALVNGPAIGIACTTLALMDLVVISDKAYFLCPFTEFGLAPEGTSSYTFPRIMGYTKAASMALFAEKMSASEAVQAGFAAKMIPHDKFRSETEKLIAKYSRLAKHSVLASKALMRPADARDRLYAANRREGEALAALFENEETIARIMQRFAPKSKM